MRTNEIKVGIIVFLALVSIFIVVFFLKDLRLGISGRYYIVQFTNLDNLMVGGHVKLNGGINVGKVIRLEVDGMFANVHFVITDPYIVLTDKVSFSISGAGLLGEKYLFMALGRGGNPVKENTRFIGKKSEAIDSLIPKISRIADSVNNILDNQLEPTLEQVKIYVQSKEVRETIKNIFTSSKGLNELINNSNRLVLDLKDKHIKETVSNINGTIKSLNKVVNNLHDENTPLGAAFKSKEMAKDMKRLVKNLNELIIEIKNNPIISSKKKYRSGPF